MSRLVYVTYEPDDGDLRRKGVWRARCGDSSATGGSIGWAIDALIGERPDRGLDKLTIVVRDPCNPLALESK